MQFLCGAQESKALFRCVNKWQRAEASEKSQTVRRESWGRWCIAALQVFVLEAPANSHSVVWLQILAILTFYIQTLNIFAEFPLNSLQNRNSVCSCVAMTCPDLFPITCKHAIVSSHFRNLPGWCEQVMFPPQCLSTLTAPRPHSIQNLCHHPDANETRRAWPQLTVDGFAPEPYCLHRLPSCGEHGGVPWRPGLW